MAGPQQPPCEAPEGIQPAGRDTRWVLPATILGSSLGFIDGSVVNVALPVIQRDLDAGLATAQWVVNGYMLMLGSLILLGGTAGDRFGQRRVFLFGLVGFVVASIGCAIAPGPVALVVARFVQGTAAAFLVPASLALIGSAFTGEERGKAIGTWAAAGALTTALGPPLGGWLVDTVGWRAIFMINVPIGALALYMGWRIASSPGLREYQKLDFAGTGLTVVGLGLLSYGLIAAGEGNTVAGLAAIVLSVPFAIAFIVVERRSAAPMVPMSLFDNRDFSGANGLTLVLYASLSGSLFLLPFVLIYAHGYSAAAAGAAMLPFSILLGAGSRWSGAVAKRIGVRPMLIVGPALTGLGYLVLAALVETGWYWIGFFPGIVVIGVGMTITVAPLTTTVFDAAPDDAGGTASGINNAAARIGGLIAVAALGFAFGGSDLANLPPEVLMTSYRWVMIAAAVMAFASAAVSWAAIGRTAPIPATQE
ncbi:MFS transporter [Pelagibacterium xiamenense]|uniref:MFS transporter n=1 Tax=Pelagibacterium xiamenense TaxID=2901140 RepID=UPI001E2B85F8|nr:MFS transporter [Pelagibacterium xiamenense]MCD7061006.1 MFS transporter [Pelagibacterium xiamenense]